MADGERVAGIVLAAGEARRYGQPKQLLRLGGRALVERALDAAQGAGLSPVVLVVGARAEAILACVGEREGLRVVRNPDWEMGMSASLRAGLAALEQDVAAAIILLADQPGVDAALLQRLLAARAGGRARLVAPACQGRRGNPVLFDRSLFPELLAVTGDQGGRTVVAAHQDELARVEVAEEALLDVDRPEDYARAVRGAFERSRIRGVSERVQTKSLTDIRNLLIDMDGVLYHGNAPVPGAREFLAWAEERDIRFLLFTNNSTLTPEQYVDKLAKMGIVVTPGHVFTSAQATAMYLPRLVPPGEALYVIGQDGLRTALAEAGYRFADSDVSAVVVGMDTQVTYEKLCLATLAIRAGALFVGTNPDVTFPSERGIVPGNGAILAAIETATGVKPIMVGKPERAIFESALDRLGAAPGNTAMIGDRPETDVLGGQQAGLMTIHVLTGVATQEDLATSGLTPDWVFEDLPALREAWVAASDGAGGGR